MPTGEPISLALGLALFAAAVGCGLGVFVIVRLVMELRMRRMLRKQGPDVTELDRDIRRYLDRVWLMVAAWTPRVEEPSASRLGELWDDAYARARALQQSRSTDAEAADDVAQLVALEKAIDEEIDRVRS